MSKKRIWAALVVALAVVGAEARAGQPERLVGAGDWSLSGADWSDEGPAVAAWMDVDGKVSKVELRRDGAVVREWTFPQALVQGVSWIVPGRRLRVSLNEIPEKPKDAHDVQSDTRIFEVSEDGGLEEVFRASEVEGEWEGVNLMKDGRWWIGFRLPPEDDFGIFEVGRVGKTQGEWSWSFGGLRGEFDPLGGSNWAQVREAAGKLFVWLLWNGKLSVVQPEGKQGAKVTELKLPYDCVEVQTFQVVEGGFWVLCRREEMFGSGPIVLAAWYPMPGGEATLAPEIVDAFLKPWFLDDGRVVDLLQRDGYAVVHAPRRDEKGEAEIIGRFELPTGPAGSRWLPSGDVLLVSEGWSQRFRVEPVKSRFEDSSP